MSTAATGVTRRSGFPPRERSGEKGEDPLRRRKARAEERCVDAVERDAHAATALRPLLPTQKLTTLPLPRRPSAKPSPPTIVVCSRRRQTRTPEPPGQIHYDARTLGPTSTRPPDWGLGRPGRKHEQEPQAAPPGRALKAHVLPVPAPQASGDRETRRQKGQSPLKSLLFLSAPDSEKQAPVGEL